MNREELRHARLKEIFGVEKPFIQVGIGDDAASLQLDTRDLLATVDASIEGVHFKRDWAALDQLAARAFVAALSDIIAMAGQPLAALCALELPREISDEQFELFVRGLARASQELNTPIVGGNLTSSAQLGITTTVFGRSRGTIALRSGARPGQTLYVSAPLGAAALGLALLQQKDRGRAIAHDEEFFVERWLEPTLAHSLVSEHHSEISAAIDISDGLAIDLKRLCDASNVGALINFSAIPCAQNFAAMCARLSLNTQNTLLSSGEEYALLFTSDNARISHVQAIALGKITQDSTVKVLDDTGAAIPLHALGFTHF